MADRPFGRREIPMSGRLAAHLLVQLDDVLLLPERLARQELELGQVAPATHDIRQKLPLRVLLHGFFVVTDGRLYLQMSITSSSDINELTYSGVAIRYRTESVLS